MSLAKRIAKHVKAMIEAREVVGKARFDLMRAGDVLALVRVSAGRCSAS